MDILKDWLARATPAQRERLAEGASTSLQYLRHIAAGRKVPGADVAARIELASAKMRVQPFKLKRWDLASVCADCPHRCGK